MYGVRTSVVVPMLHPVAIENRHKAILVIDWILFCNIK